ncbi:MAG TPA: hypothetical protein VNN25_03585 [Thermoanaerobaculia bacterium]|jgi:hypothetical protein|nr:hypothetical protein [Thermoanaerobaculia bacterium]
MHRIVRFVFAVVLASAALDAASQVTIVDNQFTHYAQGQMNSAAADNPNAYLYCWLYGNGLYCGAADGAGHYASCQTTDPAHKRLFAMIKRYSSVRFFWDPADSSCFLEVTVDSRNLRPRPVPATSKSSSPVFVDATAQYAYGSLAVKPDKPNQDIGCNEQSGFADLYCIAQDDAGNFVWCTTSKDSASQTLADMKLAVAGLNESSMLYFAWDNDPNTPTRTCNFIYVFNASYLLP